jgi:hypothetical protein
MTTYSRYGIAGLFSATEVNVLEDQSTLESEGKRDETV